MKPYGHGKANASESEIDREIDEVSEAESILSAEPEPVEKSKKEAMNATMQQSKKQRNSLLLATQRINHALYAEDISILACSYMYAQGQI